MFNLLTKIKVKDIKSIPEGGAMIFYLTDENVLKRAKSLMSQYGGKEKFNYSSEKITNNNGLTFIRLTICKNHKEKTNYGDNQRNSTIETVQ